MRRIVFVTVIALTMAGMFAATQARLLAKSEPATRSPLAAVEAMGAANQLYEAGHYAQAAQAYEQLVNQGFASGALFYNLGNAQFKQGDLGQAILNYRRTHQYIPRDPDVAANLAAARALTADQGESVDGDGILIELGRAVQGLLTLDEVAMVALGSWIALVFSLLLWGSAKSGGVWRRRVGTMSMVLAVLVAVSVLALGSTLYERSHSADGVIVAAEVDVASGPGAHYTSEFRLHSGAEVRLVELQENWIRLSMPGSEVEGWIPATAVEAIDG
jgi:tetratricopeptide (TPR) repeat protein